MIENLFKDDNQVTTFGKNEVKEKGLGLLICKEFIEMNSGQIRVESELGIRSKFYFSLPKEKLQQSFIASIEKEKRELYIKYVRKKSELIYKFKTQIVKNGRLPFRSII